MPIAFLALLTLFLPLPAQVKGAGDFEWVKNLRYYWDAEIDDCVVRMSNSRYIYGYEYLGASPRLVITPLTVRTYFRSPASVFSSAWFDLILGSVLPVFDGSIAVRFGRGSSRTSWNWQDRDH